MPTENRVRRDDRGDVTQAATAQPMPVDGQPSALVVAQAERAAYVPAQDAVFLDQVHHGVQLPPVEPAGQRREQHPERQRVEHGGRVYTTNRIAAPRNPSAEQ
jgi:hypothetical protein